MQQLWCTDKAIGWYWFLKILWNAILLVSPMNGRKCKYCDVNYDSNYHIDIFTFFTPIFNIFDFDQNVDNITDRKEYEYCK